MQVFKWGNSLAVRLPVALVKQLELQEGDEVQLSVRGKRELLIARKLPKAQVLAALREFRGR